MTGVLCVWVTDMPSAAEQWYEDEYIPQMMSRYSTRVLLGDYIGTPLDEELNGVATRDADWKSFAVYEVEDVQTASDATYDASNQPLTADHPMQGSRFDVRPYEELKRWQNDAEWNGDGADVASILFWEWQPHEGCEKPVLESFEHELGPMFAQAPEILRLRWFKIKNAATMNGNSYDTLKTEEQHTYMVFVELDCEDWPWEQLFALNSMPCWIDNFEAQKTVKWQASHYIVKRNYEGENRQQL
ncbi:hypothetical protein B5807_03633 [Epicoccum nigrum]|uniref:Uncharacterized protein n=1 Tax=Epicoccum nigrum TaxID=105696 RepID=A0A1Y2M748_EPING|nr:hypothetical protein B5807_03633 [Epicoccum nigrum]